MKIKIEMEIEGCYDCLFKTHRNMYGYSATECTKLPAYHEIAEKGFRPDCPFLKQQKDGCKNVKE